MIRLLTLVRKAPDIAPHQRFRHEQWAPHLARDHGITLEFAPFESPALTDILYQPGHRGRKTMLVLRDAARRWADRHRARDFDGAVVLREAMLVGGPVIERAIVGDGVPLIYDFDDVIWQIDTRGQNGVMTLARSPWKTAKICQLASAVTVGNDYLGDFARQFNPEVHRVRTSINLEKYRPLPAPSNEAPFTVVWTGSHSTIPHLDSIRPALEMLARKRAVRLRVVCDRPPAPFERVELDFVKWRSETEAADLAPGHVGIMPLPDTQATRGKCGCKALQCMGIGRPVVVSPVGVNSQIIDNGRNGLWATTLDEWVAQLNRLADDPGLRAQFGAAGRQTIESEFSAERSARDFAAVVHRTIGAAKRPRQP